MAKTVLVIDDDSIILQSLVAALQSSGYTVLQAAEGKSGLSIALSKHPDLIISDNLMPIMNGVDMIAQLRKDAWGATAPVILMTNMYDVNLINQTMQAGITEYLMKSDISLDKVIELTQHKIGAA